MLRTRAKYLPGVLSLCAMALMCSCGQRKVMMDRAHASETKLMNLETDAKSLQAEFNDLRKAAVEGEPAVQKKFRQLPGQRGVRTPQGRVTISDIVKKLQAQDEEIAGTKTAMEKECADLAKELAAYKDRFQKTN